MSMLRYTADCQADVDRFIRRVTEFDMVWYLDSKRGPAVSSSNDDEDDEADPTPVLLFFSDRAYARRAQLQTYPKHRPASMSLFEFMYRWLPGMTRDGVLAGPNWTGNLIGLELDPFDLREAIEAAMTPDHRERHERLYRELKQAEAGDQ